MRTLKYIPKHVRVPSYSVYLIIRSAHTYRIIPNHLTARKDASVLFCRSGNGLTLLELYEFRTTGSCMLTDRHRRCKYSIGRNERRTHLSYHRKEQPRTGYFVRRRVRTTTTTTHMLIMIKLFGQESGRLG